MSVFDEQVMFLLDRIAEDEAEAQAMMREYERGGDVVSRRWRRALGECEAKRGLVELARGLDDLDALDAELLRPGRTDRANIGATIVETLLEPYADHADFDPAWRS